MNKNSKAYVLYAIGEVFLVMVGILLALYVNNLNEERKAHQERLNILKTIRTDLVTDTLVAREIISFYDTINKYSSKVINYEYNSNTIDSCTWCRSLITIYKPFTIQDKGYNLLKEFKEFDWRHVDSLQPVITQFYKSSSDIINQSNEFIKTEALRNLEDFKNKNWFIDWMQGRFTEDMRIYFGESIEFKNKVASNFILATQNHSRFVNAHKLGAIALINSIDDQLNNQDP